MIELAWDFDPVVHEQCVDTLEWSTNLSNWVPVFVTLHIERWGGTNAYWVVKDVQPGFYRVKREWRQYIPPP